MVQAKIDLNKFFIAYRKSSYVLSNMTCKVDMGSVMIS